MKKSLGILLTNTGTPDSPSVADVKHYLKAFLSDPRVVRLPAVLWQPLLRTVILPKRSPYSAALYQKIWTAEGSPLRTTMLALSAALEAELASQLPGAVHVAVGMHYGNPSIPAALEHLRLKKIEELVVLPLFPQYSTSTTETTRMQVQACLDKTPELPSSFISHYAQYPLYIDALVKQIQKQHTPDRHLLFSFHGLPQYFVKKGDPYPEHCQQTASLVAQALGLSTHEWTLAYQSRLGYAKWLSPYTFETLEALAKNGQKRISVVCPGFSVDCLETLEEIQMRGKEAFLQAGGEDFQYIPALNATAAHITTLVEMLKETFLHYTSNS